MKWRSYLRLPIEAVRGHAIQGLLPGNEIKGEWRFLKSAIDRWLAPSQMPLMPQGYITIEDIEAAQARVPEVLALLDRWTTPDQEDYQTETWNQLDQNLPRHRPNLKIYCMSKIIILDSGPLGMVANPSAKSVQTQDCQQWIRRLYQAGYTIAVPEIANYEVRRELLRSNRTKSIDF